MHGILRSDPRSAFRWAASVAGDASRQRYLLEVATDAWGRTTPAAGKTAIEALPLPANERQDLLDRL